MRGGIERKPRWSGGPSAEAARQAQTRASRAVGPRRTSRAGVVRGGVAGFLLGAAFWIVPALQELTGSEAPKVAPAGDPQGMHAPECTSLSLDRRKGHTTAEPCLRQGLPLREARATGLGDRPLP